jgi:hypothetical protein
MNLLSEIQNRIAVIKRHKKWNELTREEKEEIIPDVYSVYADVIYYMKFCVNNQLNQD